ncbi:hypothetical protein LG201_01915 [Methylobacillus gramineus]|uniref:hypothetical protein n=1 Tax=Methylobacillus gramineus TaxID=755169 RepID=UPI001CFFFC32|nr:hypothetical protein [Methylobacillus gramineus]MCB5183958.1 hypothetical protein [Methylobacillus gramineus]
MSSKITHATIQMRIFLLSVVLALASFGIVNILHYQDGDLYLGDTAPLQVIAESLSDDGEPPASSLDLFISTFLAATIFSVGNVLLVWDRANKNFVYRLIFSTHVRPRDPPSLT